MSTIVHLLLAVILTLFLAAQASCLLFLLRYRRAGRAARRAGPADLLWTCIPIIVVLFLAARSWVAVFDLGRPAVASAVTETEAPAAPGAMPPR